MNLIEKISLQICRLGEKQGTLYFDEPFIKGQDGVVGFYLLKTFLVTFGYKSNNKNFLSFNCTYMERTRCEIYTRVMGYFRPVSQFNIGKKSEFYSRKYFKEDTDCSSKFIADYKN